MKDASLSSGPKRTTVDSRLSATDEPLPDLPGVVLQIDFQHDEN